MEGLLSNFLSKFTMTLLVIDTIRFEPRLLKLTLIFSIIRVFAGERGEHPRGLWSRSHKMIPSIPNLYFGWAPALIRGSNATREKNYAICSGRGKKGENLEPSGRRAVGKSGLGRTTKAETKKETKKGEKQQNQQKTKNKSTQLLEEGDLLLGSWVKGDQLWGGRREKEKKRRQQTHGHRRKNKKKKV